ncbi:MAG: DUF58 domain-containing protein [Candidatus Thermoplasmatota archaeon]|nr:DUF58 domain-containing protein [Candidatus Thermoplasmatota archaeon]MBU1914128.1 DUF58 domain-containing protein [Candidatus Thermoplasmatota archaeon]
MTFASAYVYAYLRFVSELQRTDLRIERRALEEVSFAQEPTSISVEILNKDPITVRGTFEDILPENCELSAGSNRSIRALPPKSILRLSYSVVPTKRGPLIIPGMKIARSGSLGLFDEEQIIEHPTVINVHTEKGSFDTARRMAGREHLEFSGMGRNPAVVLREFEFDGIREYVPGDRARDILWKLFPKLNKLMTKTYRKEGSLQTIVFVDCSRSMRLKRSKVAKIDHAVDLSMQISNVLLSSFYPAGVALFDEINVLNKASPALGRHQFKMIVKVLREAPSSMEESKGGIVRTEEREPNKTPEPKKTSLKATAEGKEFLSTLDRIATKGARPALGIGLEGGIKEIVARNRGREQLFIIISDLVSTRDAVIAGAKLCKSTGNKMLVIHTYDDWYRNAEGMPDMPEVERLYGDLSDTLRIEATFRGLGVSYIRIGPADTATRIVRAIRRGRT